MPANTCDPSVNFLINGDEWIHTCGDVTLILNGHESVTAVREAGPPCYRIWFYQYTNKSGWAVCYYPTVLLPPFTLPGDPGSIQVTSNTTPC